jgi:hypothetical protein
MVDVDLQSNVESVRSISTSKKELAMNVTNHVLVSGAHMKAHARLTVQTALTSVIYVQIPNVHSVELTQLVMTDFVVILLQT